MSFGDIPYCQLATHVDAITIYHFYYITLFSIMQFFYRFHSGMGDDFSRVI
jgi:hypothetical protein